MNDSRRFLSSLPISRSTLVCLGQIALVLLLVTWQPIVSSAQAQIQINGREISPEQMEQFRERMRGRRGGGPGGRFEGFRGQPPTAAPENNNEQKPDEKKEGEEKKDDEKKSEEETTPTIKRPTNLSVRLDPNRIRLQPDENGLVQFNYNEHPWAAVLQEYADAANLSFDWQELPADGLNLVTQKKYSLQEARDLLNRHLLARGFTLLLKGEVLSAVKVDKIDPSLVPRAEADELEDYPPHEFVRVRFKLASTMDPNQLKDDLKGLLNPKATIVPLLNTRQLLVIDSVANLRSVRDLLYAEQTASASVVTPEVFHIRYRRADYVADQIMIVLGMDPASRKSPQELQIETQRMQLLMQMQKQNKDISKMLKQDGPPVHIAVDRLQNTLLINAPPEVMAKIQRTIEYCDVPKDGAPAGDIADGIAGGGVRSTRPHKTTSASTDAVVTALMDFGQLDPLTRLQSDAGTKTIFAYATEADHQKIEEMIKNIDKNGRQVHVFWLHKLPAQSVAGTLTSLLVADEEDSGSSRSRSRGFSFPFGMFQQGQDEPEVGFKALADVDNNRLIVWANEEEIVEVKKMLVELGETLDGKRARNPSRVRVYEARSPEETARLLERLKAAFPGKMNIDLPDEAPPADEAPAADVQQDKVTRYIPANRAKFFTVQNVTEQDEIVPDEVDQVPASTSTESAPAVAEQPEVNVTVAEDGRIVVTSDDPDALDELEEVLAALEPQQRDFDFFKLKNVYAYSVVDKLEDYFSEELKGQSERVYTPWGEYAGRRDKNQGPATLGRGQMLRFVSDRYTNTVIVQGASQSQLQIIKQLIEIYDEPPKPKDYYARETAVIKLKYSRAQDIATSLKEVYRELLSSKDKEFSDREGGPSVISDERTYVFGEPSMDENGELRPVLINFDGMLAIGVDSVSNSLVVSARKEVLDNIKQTVELLDLAATPNTMIHIHRVGGGALTADKLQSLLRSSLSQPWPGGKPQQANNDSGRGSNRGGDQNREGMSERDRMRAEYQERSSRFRSSRGRGFGGRGRD